MHANGLPADAAPTLLNETPHGLSIIDIKTSLRKLKQLIHEHEDEIYMALEQDLRKPRLEAYASEIALVLHEIDLFIQKIKSWRKPRKVGSRWWTLAHFSARSEIYPEPKGRVLIIGPWNYPFHLSLLPCIGAFAAGNRFVLKPSESAPSTSALLKKLVSQWLASDIAITIDGGIEVAQALLRKRWGHIFFTGGTAIGREIMKTAAETLSPVTLELGGKSPCLLDETVNLSVALRRILWGKFYNAGQTCVAPDYLLVPQSLLPDVLEQSRKIIQEFYGSHPEASLDYGRIINHRHFVRLRKLMEYGHSAVGGGVREDSKFIAPTILTDVSPESPLMQEEIFGPLLPVIPYKSIAEALSIILERPKPLAFYIFSEDERRIETLKTLVSCGGICINDVLVHLGNLELPFGGIAESGMGAYHGYESFRTFTHFKAIEHKSLRADVSLRYPPYKVKLNKWLKKFI